MSQRASDVLCEVWEEVELCDLGGGVKVPMREGGIEPASLLAAALEARGLLFRPAPTEARRAWKRRLDDMTPPQEGGGELPPCEVEPCDLSKPTRKRLTKGQEGRVSLWVARFFLRGMTCEQASRALGFRGDMIGRFLPEQEPYTVILACEGEALFRGKLGAVVGVLRGAKTRYVLLAQDAPRLSAS